MINFRFHIVSLTAVFLAFAVGLVLGTSFLDDASERLLERQLDDLEANLNDARVENTGLDEVLTGLRDEDEALDQQLGSRLFGGQLAGVPVLVVSTRGVEAELVQRVQSAVQESNGDLLGVWWLTDRLVLDDEDAVADLVTALDLAPGDVDVDDLDALRSALAGRLADAVVAATDAPGADQVADDFHDGEDDGEDDGEGGGEGGDGLDGGASSGEPSLLARLHDGDFVDYELPEDSDADVVMLPRGGLRVVVVNGQGASVPEDEVLLPMLADIAADGPVPVVVTAPTPIATEQDETVPPGAVDPLVAAVRDDDTINEGIGTVDGLERVAGRIATVLALHDAVPGADPGHYGLGDGAQRELPAAPDEGDGG
jgi:hypothetical protein